MSENSEADVGLNSSGEADVGDPLPQHCACGSTSSP